MKIQRIEQNDPRFSSKAIECHMAFCVDDNCIEFELIDRDTAVIHAMNDHGLDEAIEELRFYAGHISVILDEKGNVYKSYPKSLFFLLDIDGIQPSQFYVSGQKLQRIKENMKISDICIPVAKLNNQWVSLDGHTRLKYLEQLNIKQATVYEEELPKYIEKFVLEAQSRGIASIADCAILDPIEYEKKWNAFCDEFFQKEVALCN